MPPSWPPVRFPSSQGHSEVYGTLYRPNAKVFLRSERGHWLLHYMLVDSGADYTLLPRTIGEVLGLHKRVTERLYRSSGVGGGKIWVVMRRIGMRIGPHVFLADVGWANSDDVPLLLGRADVFDRFDAVFKQKERVTEFQWRG